MDLQHLRQWIGRTERQTDEFTPSAVAAMGATLDRRDPEPLMGFDVPALWHWMLFKPAVRQGELGIDGHPARGSFLPPVPLPRRMWAGGRLEFHHALQVGEEVSRTSRIADVSAKEGKSGSLVFLTVRHEVHNARGLALTEDQDIVYRSESSARDGERAVRPAPAGQEFSREIVPDPVLLFRYSALTFNAHRIHYDRAYARETEGYPGLVVHGPLLATLLLDLVSRQRPDAQVRRFSFKAVSPLFDLEPFTLCGKRDHNGAIALWAQRAPGELAMSARAELA
jgi:3-methylfumaryl-CoA hydratase